MNSPKRKGTGSDSNPRVSHEPNDPHLPPLCLLFLLHPQPGTRPKPFATSCRTLSTGACKQTRASLSRGVC